ncbi:MAG: hypothetical protein R3F04_08555 [Lysobacteraceae bacterium]
MRGRVAHRNNLIYLEGYEDRVGGYRTRSYVDDYAHRHALSLRAIGTALQSNRPAGQRMVGVVRADRDNTSSLLTVE